LDGYAIHKGDRGELLVMLLFTLARDRAIGHPNEYGQPDSGRRWRSVPDFMNALFEFKRHSRSDASLKDLFANSKIFFNHWVKVHQYAIVNVQYLAQLMRRGQLYCVLRTRPESMVSSSGKLKTIRSSQINKIPASSKPWTRMNSVF
jgi:hypothetical protein